MNVAGGGERGVRQLKGGVHLAGARQHGAGDAFQLSGQAPRRPGWLAEVRSAAMVLAGHGWPVLRGTYCKGGVWRGRRGSSGLRPVDQDWPRAWPVRAAEAGRRWADEPYSVLVACGHGVDCVELPVTSASHRLLGPLREAGLCPPAMLPTVGPGRSEAGDSCLDGELDLCGAFVALKAESDCWKTSRRDVGAAP